ncbi:MAG: phage tail tube protein [Rhodoferax sp.]
MAYYFPEGGKFYYSTTFAAAKTISALSNGNPAVATSTAHGYVDDDEILITSGWDDVHESVFKVDQLSADTFSLLGMDSTNTDFFPAGTGTGTAQKVSSWIEIPQILTIDNSGGDPKFGTITPLSRRNAINVPIGFNPETLTLTLGHDPANATYQAMLAIGRVLTKCAFKQVVPGGLVTYGYGYMVTSSRAKQSAGNANSVSCTLSIQGQSISYGS